MYYALDFNIGIFYFELIKSVLVKDGFLFGIEHH
jgi:hypothetical protein